MKSLPTIIIVLFLAFFLVGCPKPEAPEPESEVKQTEQAEVKTQEKRTIPPQVPRKNPRALPPVFG